MQTTVEFVPPYPNEKLIELPLLKAVGGDALYPEAHVLPNGNIFLMAANRAQVSDPYSMAKLFDLPNIPNGKRTYPLSGTNVLLPLRPSNNYLAEILVCGGASNYLKTAPALGDCGRINPLAANPTWAMEQMTLPRFMGDAVILPDGTLFMANGAAVGYFLYYSCIDGQDSIQPRNQCFNH
jgi:hypothetical protein